MTSTTERIEQELATINEAARRIAAHARHAREYLDGYDLLHIKRALELTLEVMRVAGNDQGQPGLRTALEKVQRMQGLPEFELFTAVGTQEPAPRFTPLPPPPPTPPAPAPVVPETDAEAPAKPEQKFDVTWGH